MLTAYYIAILCICWQLFLVIEELAPHCHPRHRPSLLFWFFLTAGVAGVTIVRILRVNL